MKHHAIYIPGFGDERARFQKPAIQLWRLFGVVPHYLPVGWSRQDGYPVKVAKISALVDRLTQQHKSVSVVGVSAGASLALNVFANFPNVRKLICISGKIQSRRGSVPDQRGSDFDYSLAVAQQSLKGLDDAKRMNILTIHPHQDQVVPITDAQIAGTKDLTVPGGNHPVGIFWGITVGMISGCAFIRSG